MESEIISLKTAKYIKELEDKIKKAIEYMETNSNISLEDSVSIVIFYKELLNILKGE